MNKDELKEQALAYHRASPKGKLAIVPTKPVATQNDLSLAYSPGVAAACELIAEDPLQVSEMTARGNLVGVISNGTAVLGLGNIGPLASKPVMEGKAVLFKKFGGVDVFDIEIDEDDPAKLIDIIAALEPTFGGINLEDISAPVCFEVEEGLKARLDIPVFHDDQHGTAIIAATAVVNGLRVVDKNIGDVRLVCNGAGAAAIACLKLLVSLGVKKEHIVVCDSKGVINQSRDGLDKYKVQFQSNTEASTLEQALVGSDLFLGVSVAGALKQPWVATMAAKPIILALANPVPEILPHEVRAVRDDALICTGRSDYPNQVNNVLCFPYIFRGALDVGATEINEDMKMAVVYALADLTMAEQDESVARAYGGVMPHFGADYLIPKPFDPRLIIRIAPAVAEAAMNSGVATRPIEDMEAYKARLKNFVFRSGQFMRPIFERAKMDCKRLVFADGESRRVLQAVQKVIDEGVARPILVGRKSTILDKAKALGLGMVPDQDFEIVDLQDYPRHEQYTKRYLELRGRRGVQIEEAEIALRSNTTVVAAIMVDQGDADAMICGVLGRFRDHVARVEEIIGMASGIVSLSALTALVLADRSIFICDTHISYEPSPEEIAESVFLAARRVRAFGIEPKVALLSHSNFGSNDLPSAVKMRKALEVIRQQNPDFEVDGEMHGDTALDQDIRDRILPGALLNGEANTFVMANLDAANVGYNLVKQLTDAVPVGPMLQGANMPVHIITNSASVRGILNVAAVAAVHAQDYHSNLAKAK